VNGEIQAQESCSNSDRESRVAKEDNEYKLIKMKKKREILKKKEIKER
jgi:hypothetical protein